MPTGTVKWFNATKGYGFIEPEDGSKDTFVHISAVERAGLGTLREGQRVSYEVRPGRDGKIVCRGALGSGLTVTGGTGSVAHRAHSALRSSYRTQTSAWPCHARPTPTKRSTSSSDGTRSNEILIPV